MIVTLQNDSGLTAVANVRRSSDAKVWNGSSFVTWSDSNRATYNISAPEQSTSGLYILTIPSGIDAETQIDVSFYDLQGSTYTPLGSKTVTTPASSSTPTATTGNSTAAYTSQLDAIDTQINRMIANPRPNYKVGNTSMNFGDLLKTLYDIREKILQKLQSLQSESIETINTDVNQFGQDIADYINEEDQ